MKWSGPIIACVLVLLLTASNPLLGQQTVAPQEPASVTPAPAAAPPAETANTEAPKLRLGSGDLLDIAVFGVPELSQQARISDSGEIAFPLIGVVHLAGLTPEDARKLVETRLRDDGMLNDPHVSLFVKEYATQGISILGEVAHPGIYPLLGSRRLYDVISVAGGLTLAAGRLVTITHRDRPGEPVTVSFDSDPAKSSSYNNVEVFPGDTIVVSKAGLVYVVGDVVQPGGYIMGNNERMTVLEALAFAKGANRNAALGSAKIIRRTPDGPHEIPIPLNKILSAKASDMPLQAEDIVFVPSSAAKSAVRKTIDSIVQVATGVAIYRR
jgi:polysaccharide export outer membrane protein